MTDESIIEDRKEAFTLLMKGAYWVSHPEGRFARRIIASSHDKEPEEIVAEHLQTQKNRDYMRMFVENIHRGMQNAGRRMEDETWPERFQEYLNEKGVRIDLEDPSMVTKNRRIKRHEYYPEIIKYIRCAAEFVRSDFSEEAEFAKKAQLELLEQLEEQGCLVSYLKCDLPDR